jgi:hypothetical protein
MSHERAEAPLESPHGGLERALIDEYLRTRGYDPHALHELPEQAREGLLAQASLYASSRLSEVDSRSRYIHELHTGPERPARSRQEH